MLFYRYISENLASYVNRGEREAGNKSFDYAALSDKEAKSARDDIAANDYNLSVLRPQTNWENLYFYQKTVVLYQMPAEIERRKKQYAYYRDKLLAFPRRNQQPNNDIIYAE